MGRAGGSAVVCLLQAGGSTDVWLHPGAAGCFPGPCSPRGRRTRCRTRCRQLEQCDGFCRLLETQRGPSPGPRSWMLSLFRPTRCHRGRSGEGTRAVRPSRGVRLFLGHNNPHRLDAGKKFQPSPERKGFLPHRKPRHSGVTRGVNSGTDPAVLVLVPPGS